MVHCKILRFQCDLFSRIIFSKEYSIKYLHFFVWKNIPADHFYGIRHKIWLLHTGEKMETMRDVHSQNTKDMETATSTIQYWEYDTQHKYTWYGLIRSHSLYRI